MSEQPSLFGDDVEAGRAHPLIPLPEKLPPSINPCIDRYGPGPVGMRCKHCIHLKGFRQSATWYKCDLRKWKAKASGTVYKGPDHRVNWPACARFEPEQP